MTNKDRRGESVLPGKSKCLLKSFHYMLTSFQFYCKLRFLDKFAVAGNKIVRFVPCRINVRYLAILSCASKDNLTG